MVGYSAVELLKKIAEKLGRSIAVDVLMDTLRFFFECFSSAHCKQSQLAQLNPVEQYFGGTEELTTTGVGQQSLSEEALSSKVADDPKVETEGEMQVKATFSQDIVHVAYVDFSKLVGQINLNNHLHNLDVIEELHASFSKKKSVTKTARQSLLALAHSEQGQATFVESDESNTSSSGDSDSDDSVRDQAMYQMRAPVKISGNYVSNIGRSCFFVDLNEDTTPTVPLNHSVSVPGMSSTSTPSGGSKSSTLPHDFNSSQMSTALDGPPDSPAPRGLLEAVHGVTVSPPARDRVQTFYETEYM